MGASVAFEVIESSSTLHPGSAWTCKESAHVKRYCAQIVLKGKVEGLNALWFLHVSREQITEISHSRKPSS